jgi:anti-sigma-K factor RskA
MTDADDHTAGDRRGLLAAEYVLGVLDADARREVERRLTQEPALAADVASWEQRLSTFADEVAPVEPPEAVWPAIRGRIGAGERDIAKRTRIWRSLAFWRGLTVATTALAAACLAALIYVGVVPPAVTLVASLEETGGRTGYIATVAPGGESLLVVPAIRIAADERAHELWVIPPGGTPHSLGLVQPGGPNRIRVPRELVPHIAADAVLAVSLEPPGGSPTGQPTGPVVANGRLTRL